MDFQTPPDVCEYMASLVPEGITRVLEPTAGEGNLVRALEKRGLEVVAPDDFWLLEPGEFECVVMNLPFTPMLEGYRILYECMYISPYVIALMPWFTLINSDRRYVRISAWGIRSVTHLPRVVFPGKRVQTCVLELDRHYDGDAKLMFYTRPRRPKWIRAPNF